MNATRRGFFAVFASGLASLFCMDWQSLWHSLTGEDPKQMLADAAAEHQRKIAEQWLNNSYSRVDVPRFDKSGREIYIKPCSLWVPGEHIAAARRILDG